MVGRHILKKCIDSIITQSIIGNIDGGCAGGKSIVKSRGIIESRSREALLRA